MTIINRNCDFIYLRSRKTASTSTELHFVANTSLGKDIYTTSSDVKKYNVPKSQNRTVIKLFFFYFYLDLPGELRKRFPKIRGHLKAQEVKKLVSKKVWHQSLIVSSIRNPWDNLLSYWRWQSRGKDGRIKPIETDFEKWAWAAISGCEERIEQANAIDARNLMQDFFYIDGELVTDYLIKFEKLNESLEYLSKLINVKIPPLKFHEKKTSRVDYRRYYSDDLAEAVGDYFSEIISLGNYDF